MNDRRNDCNHGVPIGLGCPACDGDEDFPIEHKYGYFRNGGTGLGGVQIPKCTCGWQGKSVKNYNNDQHGMLKHQFDLHVERAAK